jgi:hypothetical protein
LFILDKKKRRKIVLVISSKTEDDSSVACNGLKYFVKEHLYFLATAFSCDTFNFFVLSHFESATKKQEHTK